VLSFTKTRASCQPDHARDSHTQSRRSPGSSRGRRPPPPKYGELMPQGEDLELQGDPGQAVHAAPEQVPGL
jgi:hypothetical protein